MTTEFDTVVLSHNQLDEYLEHFDWEEVGECGNESTLEMWCKMLDTPRATTGSCTNAGGNSEAGESANQGASHSGEDQSGRNEVAGGSMNDSNSNADCESLFVV
ncbi:unnamed protein product [Phytophthora fragariaefolia]|uniref:Unnamed protein product n=1 Tax=Phytophthora fragariaefolia TaxID=1490495 RepID=A0A9W6YL73_9STRA|nr:unnamed protein product [Phytophthora fragariaefolia]